MKIEIAHDALARKVYERASAEDKMRLKITTFIKDRFTYYKERGQLLISDDLAYIRPQLANVAILLNAEEQNFIRVSELKRKQYKILRYGTAAAILFTFVGLWWKASGAEKAAIAQYKEAKTANEKLEATNRELAASNKALITEQKRGEELLRSLISVEGELTEKEKVIAQALEKEKASAKELERALMDLKKANEKLALQTKKELAEAQANQKKAEREYTQLKTTVDTKIQTIENSYTLSTQAVQKMEQKDKATAFKLAAEAWENNPNNKQAVETLKKIHQAEGGGDNFNKFLPVDKIIEKYQSQFGFKRKR
jgi:vacuolar-type H+-ATPase subunit I/STV1